MVTLMLTCTLTTILKCSQINLGKVAKFGGNSLNSFKVIQLFSDGILKSSPHPLV